MTEFFGQITGFLQLVEGLIPFAVLVFLRVGAMIATLPAAGEMVLPLRLRLALAIAVTLIILPALSPTVFDPAPPGPGLGPGLRPGPAAGPPGPLLPGLAAAGNEVIAGLCLGLMLRFVIFVLQIAGTIIAQSASLAQMFSGTGPEPQPIIANLLTLGGLALFCAAGGIGRATELLLLSYQILEPGQLPDPAALARLSVTRVSRAFALGFTLAAPFVIAALLYNLTLGVINRAMPGLMVTFIGAPALTWGSLILLMLAGPLVLEVWREVMLAALSAPMGDW